MADDYEVSQLRARVIELEAQVRFLYQHFGLTYSPAPGGAAADPRMAKVMEQLRKNNLIEAIKEYRSITNVDLATAKAAVEKMKGGM